MFSANNPSDQIPQKSLQIEQDDKFFSRLLSKESSIANPSLRVYYGGLPGAVPFMWESQPGTPKFKLCDDTLPPLTPPPSYYTNPTKRPSKKSSRCNLLHTLFPKKTNNNHSVKKTKSLPISQSPPPPPSFWSSSGSDSSVVFPVNTTASKHHGMSWFSSPSSSFDSLLGDDIDEEARDGSPTSTLCFGFRRVAGSGSLKGCHVRF